MFNFFKNKNQVNTNKKNNPLENNELIDLEYTYKNQKTILLKNIDELIKLLPRKPLTNTAIIGQVEGLIGNKIPEDLKKIIRNCSGITGSSELYNKTKTYSNSFYGIDWSKPKNVLSELNFLHKILKEADDTWSDFEASDIPDLIPIGTNDFGDIYACDIRTKKVFLLYHDNPGFSDRTVYTLKEIILSNAKNNSK